MTNKPYRKDCRNYSPKTKRRNMICDWAECDGCRAFIPTVESVFVPRYHDNQNPLDMSPGDLYVNDEDILPEEQDETARLYNGDCPYVGRCIHDTTPDRCRRCFKDGVYVPTAVEDTW